MDEEYIKLLEDEADLCDGHELHFCPFCGGAPKPEIGSVDDGCKTHVNGIVFCVRCGATIHGPYTIRSRENLPELKESVLDAVYIWNLRHKSD